MKKLTFAACALLGYTVALQQKKASDLVKDISKGSKLDEYLGTLKTGGYTDYIGQIGKGGNVDDFVKYLEGRGVGDISGYLKSLYGTKGSILEYIQYLGGIGSYDDVLKLLRGNGWNGSLDDYKKYITDYEGQLGNLIKKLAQKSINYDYTCEAQHLENCLLNGITLYGPNVVLVNLDNRCQVEKVEREGIFLQTGDLLFVTGRENTCAYQEWEEPGDFSYDYDVLFPGLDYDMPLKTAPGYHQEIIVLEAVGMGQTTYDISLYWGGEAVRDVSIDVYVDQQPGLSVATPRHSC